MAHYNPMDYMYSSARIHAMETSLVTREKMERLLDAKSADDALSTLAEWGFSQVSGTDADGNTVVNREETLLRVLHEGYADVYRFIPDRGIVRFLLVPYDCNNIKAAVKAFYRGIDADEMLFDFGTVSAGTVKKMPAAGDFSALPAHLAAAAPEAMEDYAKTHDPQHIDLILDRAAYADMLELAQETGIPNAARIVQAKIDITNLMIALRLCRIGNRFTGRDLLSRALLPGGMLSPEFFLKAYDEGEEGVIDSLTYTDYSRLMDAIKESNRSLSSIERLADDAWMEQVKKIAGHPFGAEVVIGYLIGLETEVRNLRILLGGKDAGLPADSIRERMRANYV